MDAETKPEESLASSNLPAPLLRAIKHVFAPRVGGVVLVGGTALAGFYAAHRRSDDMDLFTATPEAQVATVRIVGTLESLGATISERLTTPSYSHCVVALSGHQFTVDVVLDANAHATGTFNTTPSGICVASLTTLLMMKAATLVSRCSEKDLFDLLWLTTHLGMPNPEQWLQLGQNIDKGMTAEAVLIALASAEPKLSSCGFATERGVTANAVLKQITTFKLTLANQFMAYLETLAPRPDLLKLFRFLKRR